MPAHASLGGLCSAQEAPEVLCGGRGGGCLSHAARLVPWKGRRSAAPASPNDFDPVM